MKGLILAITLTLSAEACADLPPDVGRWQSMALEDIEAAHARIVEAHPGVIDAERPDFNTWVQQGHEQAKALVKYVMSYDTAVAAVRFYTSGFKDDHLTYSDDIREDFPIWVTGWNIERKDGQYVVATVVPDWSAELPPIGSTWTGCDGDQSDEVLEAVVGPFVNRRSGDRSREQQAAMLWMRRPVPENLRECTFVAPEGDMVRLAVSYQPITTRKFVDAWPRVNSGDANARNSFDLTDGLLWVNAGRLNMREDSSDLLELDQMLAGLEAVTGARAIVFDVRGNRGGDSGIGDRIFAAATGGLDFEQDDLDSLPPYYAQWRVSDFLVAYLGSNVERSRRLYGADSSRVRNEVAFRDRVLTAKALGQSWVDQPAGRSMTRTDVAARNGHLRRFDGKIALLTDSGCMSACLDFVDVVLQAPNSMHVGQTTGADSVYMVGSLSRLPSGNRFMMPVKVWRNRTRGNNESLSPDLLVDLDREESEVRRDVRRALGLN